MFAIVRAVRAMDGAACFMVCATLLAMPVAAQPYPAKAIRLVIPYPPGGGTDIVARLSREFPAALKNTELRQRLSAEAFEPIGSSPEALGVYMKSEIARWAKLVKATNTRID